MSGLAVLFARDGRPPDREALSVMLGAAPYRGPDGLRLRLLGAVGLGHALNAIAEEDDVQPLVSPRTGCAIIADVRLDNRDELLARLPDAPPRGASDAELILRVYEAWGAAAAADLLGDFAFVIWDPRAQQLVCGRDTSGQRTLFYRADGRTFAAASEIQQLLQDPSVPVAPNAERIRHLLTPLNLYRNEKDSATTFFAGISAIPAGHILTVDRATLHVRRYWQLEPPRELRYRRDEEYAEHFRSLFFDVVRARLRGSRRIGALLSGGLDSSSIVCAAQELSRAGRASDHGFISFSSVYDGLVCDEQDLIAEIQAKYGFDARYIPVREAGSRLQLEPHGFIESPNMGDGGLRDTICGVAVQADVRVLLSGDIADGCLGGSRLVFDSLLRRGALGEFTRHLRAYRRVADESLQKTLILHCLAPLLPRGAQTRVMSAHLRRTVRQIGWSITPPWMPESVRADLVQRHLDLSLAEERARRFANPTRHFEYSLLDPPEIVHHPAPWPLEIWRPFADRRLHEFLLAIPPEQKFAPHPETDEFYAGSKRVLRAAMRGVLPERIRTRTSKTVFDATVGSEIERRWNTYEAAFGPAARSEVAAYGLVDQGRFWSRLQELRAGVNGGDFIYITQIVGLETWLRSLRLRRQHVAIPAPRSLTSPPGVPRAVLAAAAGAG